MKFTASMVALVAVAAQAAAVNSDDGYPSQVFERGVGFAGTPGQTGYIAKRAAEAVAMAIANPDARKKAPGGHIGFCSVPGMACVEKRDAEAQETAQGGYIGFCSVPGMACVEKRAAVEKINARAHDLFNTLEARDAEADATAISAARKKAPGGHIGFCSVPGMACVEKREPQADLIGRRIKGGHIGFCSVPGMACMERRSAEADADAKKKKKHKASNVKGGYIGFCSVPGMACVEKRAETVEILNKIRSAFPDVEKRECFGPEGPCTQILEAHHAFREVRRRAAEPNPNAFAHDELSSVARGYMVARDEGHPLVKESEIASWGPEGANTLAARALSELEDAINEGVESLKTM